MATLLIGAVLFYETFSFRRVDWDWMGLPFWPRLVLGFLMLLGVIFIIRGSLDEGPFNSLNAKAFLVLAGGAVYVALIPVLGYLIVTPVFIAGFSYALGPRTARSVLQALLVAAIATALIYSVFTEALYVQFPEGLMEEQL